MTSASTSSASPTSAAKPAAASGEGAVPFFEGLKQEFFKITWPTPPQVIANTVVVIVLVSVVSLWMWGMDNLFRAVIMLLTEVLPKQFG